MLTHVERVLERREQGYSPASDFYRPLRQGIVRYHKGRIDFEDLIERMRTLGSSTQRLHLPDAAESYRKFLETHDVRWVENARKEIWMCGDLEVRVNPELCVEVDGVECLQKLYFKQERLDRHRLGTIFELFRESFDERCGVLDVRRGTLYLQDEACKRFRPLLIGEAHSFALVAEELNFAA